MRTLKQIQAGLVDRRIDRVADATGLSRATISTVRDNTNVNPTYTTLKALDEYLTSVSQPVDGGE